MPLIVKKIVALSFIVLTLVLTNFAQPDAGLRKQLSRARVLLATKNYNAAVLELNTIRKDSQDEYVQNVALSMLMNVFIEQNDYKKAQDLLTETYISQKSSAKNTAVYYSVAAQIVRGSKTQVERYRLLGLNVRDVNLPKEADADVDKMRALLELVVKQTEDLGVGGKQTEDSMALLDESANARSVIARDEYDANRWKIKIIDSREKMATSRSKVVNVYDDPLVTSESVALSTPPKPEPTPLKVLEKSGVLPKVEQPVKTQEVAKIELKPLETKTIFVPKQTEFLPAKLEVAKPDAVTDKADETKKSTSEEASKNSTTNQNNDTSVEKQNIIVPNIFSNEPMQIGSLREYATTAIQPQYPIIAKNMRLSGVVQIDILIDETGKVATIEKSSGPDILKRAATDALKKWKFKPFLRDGQAVKAAGFVKFNFAL
jgi:periplasmic protein TonB